MIHIDFFVNSTLSKHQLQIIFGLFLANTLVTYWCGAYKSVMLISNQEKYIYSRIRVVIFSFISFFQIYALLAFRSFEVYLIISIVFEICQNVYISKLIDKKYSFLNINKKELLSRDEKKGLIRNIFGMAMYKISTMVSVSIDNIVISKFLNIVLVGIYSNYTLIVTTLNSIMNAIFDASIASIGNLSLEKDQMKNTIILDVFSYLSFFFYGICSVDLYVLLNRFIDLWLGKDFLLSRITVFLIVLNFLTLGLQKSIIVLKLRT